jgi:hypothetical protein
MSNLKLDITTQLDDGDVQYTFRIFDLETPVNSHSFDCVYFAQGYDYEEMIESIKKGLYKEVLNDFQF